MNVGHAQTTTLTSKHTEYLHNSWLHANECAQQCASGNPLSIRFGFPVPMSLPRCRRYRRTQYRIVFIQIGVIHYVRPSWVDSRYNVMLGRVYGSDCIWCAQHISAKGIYCKYIFRARAINNSECDRFDADIFVVLIYASAPSFSLSMLLGKFD